MTADKDSSDSAVTQAVASQNLQGFPWGICLIYTEASHIKQQLGE